MSEATASRAARKMDKENGDGGGGGGSGKHKSSSNNGGQPNIDVNDPNSLLNAASLFGKFQRAILS